MQNTRLRRRRTNLSDGTLHFTWHIGRVHQVMEDENVKYANDTQRQGVVHDEPEHDDTFCIFGAPFLAKRIAKAERLVAVDAKVLRI